MTDFLSFIMLEEQVDIPPSRKTYGMAGKLDYNDVVPLILVIIERETPSVPSRTRQGNLVSPMVLRLKPRKSRSSPESKAS